MFRFDVGYYCAIFGRSDQGAARVAAQESVKIAGVCLGFARDSYYIMAEKTIIQSFGYNSAVADGSGTSE
jgi:hypothetical protein